MLSLASKIDFNNKNIQSSCSWEKLVKLFNISDFYYNDDKRLKCYFIKYGFVLILMLELKRIF
jgi:hypothetical protein